MLQAKFSVEEEQARFLNDYSAWENTRDASSSLTKRRFSMKYSQAKQGHIFVIRLEDGDIVHKEIERFARNQSIKAAALIIIVGADGMW